MTDERSAARVKDVADHVAAGGTYSRKDSYEMPRTPKAPAVHQGDVPLNMRTDLGNAERFTADHSDAVRYCYPWKSWLVWDRNRWRRDAGAEIERLAARTAREITSEMLAAASVTTDDNERKAYIRWAMGTQALPRIRAMAEGARHMLAVAPGDLDRDPWLLGTPLGTLDLRTGLLRLPSRDDLMTKTTGVKYDPDRETPIWDAFLRQVFGGDQELIRYVQRAAGYSLTGLTGEQIFFLAIGPGANGKSTFVGVLHRILGDYAMAASFELFTAARTDRNKGPHLAALDGARLVYAAEPNPGAPFDEALLKSVTGGDTVTGERKYEAPYEFTPKCKIWLAANMPPAWRRGGPSLARRVRVVPFDVTIPTSDRDPDLVARLIEEEGPGILAWAVRGCLDWQRGGLAAPAVATKAGDEYERQADPIAEWAETRLLKVPEGVYRLLLKELHDDYVTWAEAEGLRPIAARTLSGLLAARGWVRVRTKHGFAFEGCTFAPRI